MSRKWGRDIPDWVPPWLEHVGRWLRQHPWLHAFGYGVGVVLLLLLWAWLDLISGRSSVQPRDQLGNNLVVGAFVVLVIRYLDLAHAYALLHPWRGAGVAGLATLVLVLVLGELPGTTSGGAVTPWLAVAIGLFIFVLIGVLFSHGIGTGGQGGRDGRASERPEDQS